MTFPASPHPRALAEALLDELLPEPGGLQRARCPVGLGASASVSSPRGASLGDATENRLDGLLAARAHRAERQRVPVVLVAARQVPEQIADRPDLEPREELADPDPTPHRRVTGRSSELRGGYPVGQRFGPWLPAGDIGRLASFREVTPAKPGKRL